MTTANKLARHSARPQQISTKQSTSRHPEIASTLRASPPQFIVTDNAIEFGCITSSSWLRDLLKELGVRHVL